MKKKYQNPTFDCQPLREISIIATSDTDAAIQTSTADVNDVARGSTRGSASPWDDDFSF